MDSEVLIGILKKKGFRIFFKFRKHSVAIINTCAFTEDAKQESIDCILELAQLKREGRLLSLIVTGCLSQRYSKRLMKDISEIDGVFGAGDFVKIPRYIEKILSGKKVAVVDKKPRFLYNHTTPRSIMTPRHSVYVKIQEGCMNRCSFCVIPKVRGRFRSRSMGSLLREITALRASGAREVNLIGQDTTLYGMERYKKPALAALLKKASGIMESGWLRLLYTHPAHYNQKLIDIIRGEHSICKYLDLPIQHISDKILRKMARRVTKKDIISLIEKLRKEIPGVALRTSIIVGFPGENEKDFSELVEFIREFEFDRLGVFLYSREEGTRAYNFKGHLPHEEKENRFDRIMQLAKGISEKNNRAYMGKTLKVLVDEKDPDINGQYIGRTEHDAPEVDGMVYVKSARPLSKGDFVNVRIEDTLEYDLVGSA